MYRVLSLFSGIGAFEKAISNLKIPHKVIGYSDIYPQAVQSYSLIHNIPIELNLGSITEIDETKIEEYDLLVFGSPCTNISKLGNGKGLDGEESKLFFDASRILNYTKPKYFVFENVNTLLTSNGGKDWEIVKFHLSANYNIYYNVLDARDYGLPQSRRRLFIVGIRKDIEQTFEFPTPIGCDLWFRDLLDEEYSAKYFHSQKGIDYMNKTTKDGRTHWDFRFHQDTDEQFAHCLVANYYKGVPYNVLIDRRYNATIVRRMTPYETMKLMGFTEEDCQILKDNKIADTHIFKMSGNSICVNVLEHIFKNLLI